MKPYEPFKGGKIPRANCEARWIKLGDQMTAGDCVVVQTRTEANNFSNTLRRKNIKAVMRKTPSGLYRVWKIS